MEKGECLMRWWLSLAVGFALAGTACAESNSSTQVISESAVEIEALPALRPAIKTAELLTPAASLAVSYTHLTLPTILLV